MNQRSLGNTGIDVSEIAFGGVEIGLPYGPGIRSQKDMMQEEEAVGLLRHALDKGINFFDTARMYGRSERLMGKAFVDIREKVILCSKCQHLRDSSGQLPTPSRLTALIHRSLEESLGALGTDYLDVWMLHQADLEILRHETVCRVFQDIQKAGKVRVIGASTYTVPESETAIRSGVWQVVQLPFNLLDQRQAVVFDLAAEKGVGLVVRSVLLRGMLTDRGRHLKAPLNKIESHIARYRDLAGNNHIDLPEYATRFVLAQAQVSAVLLGIDRLEYLDVAVETAAKGLIPEALLRGARPFPDPEFIDIPHWDRMGWLD
ncbi:Predicted oxidoreductase [Cyclobacterium lianum]|uniref:Predicted oxidoreductase n=1 Tax=Cyclobacterium lianum TaxID=388280 RepID=A0A1M7PDE1_9BACT|nr:aldo/keto reductase [Cyclobacterium lianum]SHN14473.1 Predicted oxidoreductase [Cyclobacterium lianum]